MQWGGILLKRRTAVVALIFLAAVCWSCAAVGQSYQPSESNLKARQWFQDAKFGMFIHWGVYSVPGRGEWVMENEKIPIAEYEKFAPQFNPTEFTAADIVSLASRGHEIHHDNEQAPRWIRDVCHTAEQVEHRGCDALREGPVKAIGGGMPQAGNKAVFLSLAAGLA